MIPKIPADISLPDPVLGTGSIIALVFSCLFIYLSLSGIRQLRLIPATFYCLLSTLFLGAAAIIMLAALNIHSYQRLNHESEVAELHFTQLKQQLFRVDIYFVQTRQSRQFELRGDEWQLDARIIKWKAPLTLLGFDSIYGLDRLQGRYRDIEQEQGAPRSVFALNPANSLDLWTLISKYRHYLPWLDAYYGSASYLPMSDDSIFQVNVTQSGLIARPLNKPAQSAIENWD